jgi:hypothetical protein
VVSQPLPLATGWGSANSYGTGDPGYFVGSDGIVHLTGSAMWSGPGQPGNDPGLGFICGYLPAWARPGRLEEMNTYNYAGQLGFVLADTNGNVYCDANGDVGSNFGFTSLTGVSFPANSAWLPLTLQGNWYSAAGASFQIDDGVVYLAGSILDFPVTGGVVATLPAGARPSHSLWLLANTSDPDSAVLRIDPDGDIYIFGQQQDLADSISIDGTSFRLGS